MPMYSAMKLTLQTQLLPSIDQIAKLEATLRAFNSGADWLAGRLPVGAAGRSRAAGLVCAGAADGALV